MSVTNSELLGYYRDIARIGRLRSGEDLADLNDLMGKVEALRGKISDQRVFQQIDDKCQWLLDRFFARDNLRALDQCKERLKQFTSPACKSELSFLSKKVKDINQTLSSVSLNNDEKIVYRFLSEGLSEQFERLNCYGILEACNEKLIFIYDRAPEVIADQVLDILLIVRNIETIVHSKLVGEDQRKCKIWLQTIDLTVKLLEERFPSLKRVFSSLDAEASRLHELQTSLESYTPKDKPQIEYVKGRFENCEANIRKIESDLQSLNLDPVKKNYFQRILQTIEEMIRAIKALFQKLEQPKVMPVGKIIPEKTWLSRIVSLTRRIFV